MIYAFGDIHGQHTMLMALLDTLEKLPIAEDDGLVFVGDYIDRGENSRAVIETMLDLRRKRAHVVFLRGNHEQLMLDARDGRHRRADDDDADPSHLEETLIWMQNGGRETLASYGVDLIDEWVQAIPKEHWQFIESTTMEYVVGRLHFVHAGLLPPGAKWPAWKFELDPRLWIREPFLNSRADFAGRVVVFGHTPQRTGQPLVTPSKIGLDTGAVYGGPLTVAALDPNSHARRQVLRTLYQAQYAELDESFA